MRKYGVTLILGIIFCVRFVAICNVKTFVCPVVQAEWGSESTIAKSISGLRVSATQNVRLYFPSPHSELVLGVLLGINDLTFVPTFNDIVRLTGTIHVIVVSGYNISLVYGLLVSALGSKFKLKTILAAQAVTLLYAVISGFDPPVIRAWLMGFAVVLAKAYGRKIDPMQVLIFSAGVMLAVDPVYVTSLSFQLSFLATFGLVYYSDVLTHFIKGTNTLAKDFTATVSAQILVWPLIAYRFEQVSIISPLVNALVLWTIPLATILGGVFLLSTYISTLIPALTILSKLLYLVTLVPTDVFVQTSRLFAQLEFASLMFKPTVNFLLIYYLCALLVPKVVSNKWR